MQNTFRHNTQLYRLPPTASVVQKKFCPNLKIKWFASSNFNFRVASARVIRGFEYGIFGYDGEDARIAVA